MTFDEWWDTRLLSKETAMPLLIKSFRDECEQAWNAALSSRPEVVHSQKCICPNCGTQMAWDLGIPSTNVGK